MNKKQGGDVNFIFEGIGRVGKSTLINRLMEINPSRYMKLGPWTTISRMFYDFSIYLMRLRENTLDMPSYVIDRGHTSEMAYGPLYFPERYNDATIMHHMLYIDKVLSKTNTGVFNHRESVIVYIEPTNIDRLMPDKRCGNKREFDLAAFRGAIAQTSLRVIRLNTQNSNGDWRNVYDVIDELMERV